MANDYGYELTEEDRRGLKGEIVKAKIQEDYSRVDVYYQTLNVKVIVQKPVYSSVSSNLIPDYDHHPDFFHSRMMSWFLVLEEFWVCILASP